MTDTRTEIDPSPPTVDEWRAQVLRFEGRGMMLQAYDAAAHALQEYPDDPWLKHRAVLALVRSGATETAKRRYREYGLDKADDEDIAALGAWCAPARCGIRV